MYKCMYDNVNDKKKNGFQASWTAQHSASNWRERKISLFIYLCGSLLLHEPPVASF